MRRHCCRRYESIKGQRQAELQALEEEQRLIDLLRADELEQSTRLEAQRRRERSQQLRLQMAEANRIQIQLKVSDRFTAVQVFRQGRAIYLVQLRA